VTGKTDAKLAPRLLGCSGRAHAQSFGTRRAWLAGPM